MFYNKKNRYACLEKLITLKNQVFKNYLTPKRYTKLIKMYKHWMLIPEHQCCKNHGDKNIEIYRLVKYIFCVGIYKFN